MLDAFAYPFMQRALLGGLLVAAVAGYLGVFVVQRGLSFLGNGLAHAAFGGVALGLLLGVKPLWVALPFTVVVALGIVWVEQRTKLEGDTAIGVFFAVSMAAGVALLAMRDRNATDAMAYLFGSILAVQTADIIVAAVLFVAALVLAVPLWGRWAFASFDRELAAGDHLPVRRDDYLLAAWVAVVVVCSVKLVGIVLAASFLVIPAAAARLLSRTLLAMTLWSVAIACGSVMFGLWLSLIHDPPAGAAIVLTQAGVFGAALLLEIVRHRLRRR